MVTRTNAESIGRTLLPIVFKRRWFVSSVYDGEIEFHSVPPPGDVSIRYRMRIGLATLLLRFCPCCGTGHSLSFCVNSAKLIAEDKELNLGR